MALTVASIRRERDPAEPERLLALMVDHVAESWLAAEARSEGLEQELADEREETARARDEAEELEEMLDAGLPTGRQFQVLQLLASRGGRATPAELAAQVEEARRRHHPDEPPVHAGAILAEGRAMAKAARWVAVIGTTSDTLVLTRRGRTILGHCKAELVEELHAALREQGERN